MTEFDWDTIIIAHVGLIVGLIFGGYLIWSMIQNLI